MYKTAKRTTVDLNTTKIYLLKAKPRKHDIYVKIVFSIDKDDYYYNPKFLFASSFISNKKLFHIYKDSTSTKIGIVENQKLKKIFD